MFQTRGIILDCLPSRCAKAEGRSFGAALRATLQQTCLLGGGKDVVHEPRSAVIARCTCGQNANDL